MTQYIRLNENNDIIKCFSDKEELPLKTDINVNDLNINVLEHHNVFLFKYIDGEVIMKTPEEQMICFESFPKQVNEQEKLRADIDFLLMLAGE